jgi:hypothetical protein
MNVQGRPQLTQSVQQFNATAAGDLVGVRTQIVANASTGAVAQVADPNANLHLSAESTSAFTFNGLDLTAAGTPAIARTFKRAAGATQVVTITLEQPIDGNTSYTLDTAGAALTIMPRGVDGWITVAALGTVTAVP